MRELIWLEDGQSVTTYEDVTDFDVTDGGVARFECASEFGRAKKTLYVASGLLQMSVAPDDPKET